jgi:hypothetical protein
MLGCAPSHIRRVRIRIYHCGLAEKRVRPYSQLMTQLDNVDLIDSDAFDCKVCMVPHDDEIHAATLSLREWFHYEVTKYFFDDIPVEDEEAGMEWYLEVA